mmetsp:Transcript_9994/g.25802  ORF Transcript_9994/g.25802 Transcript_9994/m.25802 type:complete len:213 (+) Transcript_9994:585-1223(+)
MCAPNACSRHVQPTCTCHVHVHMHMRERDVTILLRGIRSPGAAQIDAGARTLLRGLGRRLRQAAQHSRSRPPGGMGRTALGWRLRPQATAVAAAADSSREGPAVRPVAAGTRVARCRPAARRHSWGWQRTTEHTRTQAVEGRSRAAVRHRPMVAAARSPGAARRMPEVAHTARHAAAARQPWRRVAGGRRHVLRSRRSSRERPEPAFPCPRC